MNVLSPSPSPWHDELETMTSHSWLSSTVSSLALDVTHSAPQHCCLAKHHCSQDDHSIPQHHTAGSTQSAGHREDPTSPWSPSTALTATALSTSRHHTSYPRHQYSPSRRRPQTIPDEPPKRCRPCLLCLRWRTAACGGVGGMLRLCEGVKSHDAPTTTRS